MKKFILYAFSFLGAGLPYQIFADDINESPNILIFIADDLGWEEVGVYGHPVVDTPNIDWLAYHGIRFNNFFLTASSSSPSRSSILTGMYPSCTRARNLHDKLPAHSILFSDCLRENGYYTMLVGKNHGTNSPDVEKRFNFLKTVTKPWEMGSSWVEALQQRPKDKPFFMFAASLDPHRPYKQGIYERKYSPDDVVIPPYLPDSPEMREDLADYYDEITRFDTHIGEVLNLLRDEKILDNTIIIVMSDNGRPFAQCKTRVNVQGIKSPFVVYFPKLIAQGTITESLASAVDIAPTLLEFTGIKCPPGMQGISVLPILEDNDAEVRNFAFAEHNWHAFKAYERAVITKDLLYIKNWLPHLSNPVSGEVMLTPAYAHMLEDFKNGKLRREYQDCFVAPRPKEELFEIKKDIHCLKNVASKRKSRKKLEQLRLVLRTWQESVGDVFPGEFNLKQDDGRFERPLGR